MNKMNNKAVLHCRESSKIVETIQIDTSITQIGT